MLTVFPFCRSFTPPASSTLTRIVSEAISNPSMPSASWTPDNIRAAVSDVAHCLRKELVGGEEIFVGIPSKILGAVKKHQNVQVSAVCEASCIMRRANAMSKTKCKSCSDNTCYIHCPWQLSSLAATLYDKLTRSPAPPSLRVSQSVVWT